MAFGVERGCVLCGEPVTSCVLPAYCLRCDPGLKRVCEDVLDRAVSARLNAKPAAEGEGGEREEAE